VTAHTHSTFVAGCYRCDLSREEVMAEFRDAIAKTTFNTTDITTNSENARIADAVMAMPEMQAIRKALRCWWEHCACNDHSITDDPVDDFPDSVLAWVLDEGSNP
jgi:uncharacterized iron-regulated protein